MKKLIEKLEKNTPADRDDITNFEIDASLKLPQEYIEFLLVTNGGEGFIGENSYAIFWGVNELLEMNKAYEVEEYAKGLLLFGSDGGGDAFAFDMKNQMQIVRVPFVGMDLDEIEIIAEGFLNFLRRLQEQ